MTQTAHQKPVTAKQLNTLWAIALSMLLLAIALAAISFVIEKRYSDQLRDQYFPQLHQTNEQLITLSRLLAATKSLNDTKLVRQIEESHQVWLLQAKPAIKLLKKNGRLLPKLKALIDYEKNALTRINDNANRNLALTQMAIEQTDSALAALANQTSQQTLLQTSPQQTAPQQTIALNSALLLLKASLADSSEQPFPASLNSITAQVEQLSQWVAQQPNRYVTPSHQALVGSINDLVNIFTQEQALLGKWQGQQRRYSLFQAKVNAAIKELNQYQSLLSKDVAKTMNSAESSSVLSLSFEDYQIPLAELVTWLMWSAFTLSAISLLLLYRLHHRHQARLDQLVTFTTQKLANNEAMDLQNSVAEIPVKDSSPEESASKLSQEEQGQEEGLEEQNQEKGIEDKGIEEQGIAQQSEEKLSQEKKPSQESLVTKRQQEVAGAINSRLRHTFSSQYVDGLIAAQNKQWQQLADYAATWQWSTKNGKILLPEHINCSQLLSLGTRSDINSNIAPQQSLSRFSLRRLIGKQNFAALMSTTAVIEQQETSDVHHQNSAKHVLLSFDETVFIDVAIDKADGEWLGTLTDCSAAYCQIKQLNNELNTLKQASEQQNNSSLQATLGNYQAISKMLIQGLLQAQSSALSETSIYRQPLHYKALLRALNRLDELQTMTQLATKQRLRMSQDINISKLNAAISGNLGRELAARKNSVLIQQAANVQEKVHLDVSLYSRLIEGFCYLMLAGLHKQQLVVTLSVADQAKGQQTWRFNFTLLDCHGLNRVGANVAQNSLEQSPLAALVDDPSNTNHHETAYCQQILSAMHGQLIAINQNCLDNTTAKQNNAELVLSIPVAVVGHIAKRQESDELCHVRVLVLSSDHAQLEYLTHCLQSAKAECFRVENINEFNEQCSDSVVRQNPIDGVVVGGEFTAQYQVIQQQLDLLPKKIRPALTLVHSKTDDLAKIGLFSLMDNVLTNASLINTIKTGLKQKRDNNQLISASTLNQHKFGCSSAELLLAVKQIEQHQTLLMLLNWLGFQVTIVADGASMLSQWQTGRFLVLINEFSESPVIELLAGKGISRGIFNIGAEAESQSVNSAARQHNDSDLSHSSSWQFHTVSAVFELEKWLQSLSPWLVSQKTEANPPLPYMELVSTGSAEALLSVAFDIEAYARNQGSAELAAYMLDDYINELISHTRQLGEQLKYADHEVILKTVNELMMIAKIMSAQGLVQLLLQFKQALTNNAINANKRLIEQIKQEILLLKQHAEAI